MNETDKTAIEIVKNLQSNIRNTTIAMVGIFSIAILMAMFWAGGTNNKVDTNTENIKELTQTVRDYIKENDKCKGNYVNKDEMIGFQTAWNEMSLNWGHISYWAEAQGYRPLTRSQKKAALDTKIN